MFRRILIPLDGSPRAEAILPQVARLLKRKDSEILLLRAIPLPLAAKGPREPALLDRERGEAQKYVHDLAKRFMDEGANVRGKVAEGPPAAAIQKAARDENATMIAMTTHGRTGLARWMLGSVAEKVVRATDLPVLLVRSFRPSSQGGFEPVTSVELRFRKILVPTDGSDAALAIAPAATLFALLFGSEIIVLHVESIVPQGAALPGMEAGAPLATLTPPPADEDPAIGKMAERLTQAGLRVTRRTSLGDPASEIIDRSIASGVDLIAMATHGRSGLARWMLGSVTERVLRHAGVPLLIVRAAAKARPRAPRREAAGSGFA
jgi:nucleotide-binding universal stress UspA family protein